MRVWVRSLASVSGLRSELWWSLRCGLDPTLLWLWHRLEAIALIRLLAWELSYEALKPKKKKKSSVSWHNIDVT